MFQFLIVAVLVPALSMAVVSFSACPNGAPSPTSIEVNDCTGDICTLMVGQPLYAVAHGIVSPQGSESAVNEIVTRGDGGKGLPQPLPIVNTGGIVGGGPVVAGLPFSHVLSADSLDGSVRGLVEVEVNLIGDDGLRLGCARFLANFQ